MNIEGKILIIDDEIDICEQLSGLLNDRGFKCNYCISSDEGIKEFKKNSYSLVILDIWLNNSKFLFQKRVHANTQKKYCAN